ncbi:hypothetical protein TNCV_2735021 [Trichonephila clavipes]|nr:hypothetical protein TNCV_2735021 [Trichonephila clavipes]
MYLILEENIKVIDILVEPPSSNFLAACKKNHQTKSEKWLLEVRSRRNVTTRKKLAAARKLVEKTDRIRHFNRKFENNSLHWKLFVALTNQLTVESKNAKAQGIVLALR